MNPDDRPAWTVEASVIVVTHNNEDLIARCLASIEAGARHTSHEIIVVDNASTDATRQHAAEVVGKDAIIALAENIGFAAANNRGIREAKGRLLVLVNSDAFPDPGSIDALADAIDAIPRAVIVGGRLRYPSGQAQPSTGSFPSLRGGLWVALGLHRLPFTSRAGVGIHAHPQLYRARRRVDWVTAAFCVATREAGPLPERGFMYGEDVEWAHAAQRHGGQVWVEPAARAVHVGGASVRASQAAEFAQVKRAEFELAWFSRRGATATLGARAVLALHAIVRIVGFALAGARRRERDPHVRQFAGLARAAFTSAGRQGSRPGSSTTLPR